MNAASIFLGLLIVLFMILLLHWIHKAKPQVNTWNPVPQNCRTDNENYTGGCDEPQTRKPLSIVASDMLHTYRSIRTGISEVNMADGMQKDWRELCVAVTNESDPTKLTSLVQELIEALAKGERRWRHATRPPDAIEMNREAA